MNQIDDTRTVGDIHHDKVIAERNKLSRQVRKLKEKVAALEAENNTLKTLIENARITQNDATSENG